MLTADEIKSIVSIEQVLSVMYGHEVKNRMDCPIHGGDNCFIIKDNYFKCFSCNESGDIFRLVEVLNKIDFKEALKIICENFNIPYSVTTEEEKQEYKKKLEQIKKEQHKKQVLRKLRDYQQVRICEALRNLRTPSGDTFPEKHLEELLSQYERKHDFYIKHDIHAQLEGLLKRYKVCIL